MKKKIITLLLLTAFSVSLCACGNADVESTETQVGESIEVTIDSSVVNITELSKSELLALTPEEIQESVEMYLPNYRQIYKIDEDRNMSADDWSLLRDIICIELYGSLNDDSAVDAVENLADDPDAIYYAPSIESIEAMELADFAVYLNNMNTYYGGSDEVDFTQESEEFLQQKKQEYIDQLKETYEEAGISEGVAIPSDTIGREEIGNDTED